jgi:hypothetical protein
MRSTLGQRCASASERGNTTVRCSCRVCRAALLRRAGGSDRHQPSGIPLERGKVGFSRGWRGEIPGCGTHLGENSPEAMSPPRDLALSIGVSGPHRASRDAPRAPAGAALFVIDGGTTA